MDVRELVFQYLMHNPKYRSLRSALKKRFLYGVKTNTLDFDSEKKDLYDWITDSQTVGEIYDSLKVYPSKKDMEFVTNNMLYEIGRTNQESLNDLGLNLSHGERGQFTTPDNTYTWSAYWAFPGSSREWHGGKRKKNPDTFVEKCGRANKSGSRRAKYKCYQLASEGEHRGKKIYKPKGE